MDRVSEWQHKIPVQGHMIVLRATSPGWADMPGGKGREAYMSTNHNVINRSYVNRDRLLLES